MLENRTKRASKNMIIALISYAIQLVVGFIVRRYFIYYLGEAYLGLSSLFSNILSILSLAELGFGTAIIFAMYKPMAEQDAEKVKQLLQQFKKYYSIIGTIIFVLGISILPVLKYIVGDVGNLDVNLYIAYIIYLVQSVVTYFLAHRRALFGTSQRNDIETTINLICNILLYVLQLISVIVIKSYYAYIISAVLLNIFNNILVLVVTNRQYAEYIGKPLTRLPLDERQSINKNVLAMIFHKIGGVLVFATDSILTTLLVDDGLGVLGKYSNYTLITTSITTIMYLLISATKGSMGNAVALKNPEENYKLKKKIEFLYLWLTSFCTICIFVLIEPFINVILTKGNSQSLLLGKEIALLVCASFFLTHSRQITLAYIDVVGLFRPWRFKALFEAIINLVVSIVLGMELGLVGIIIGTLTSTIFMPLWVEPMVLEKHYFKNGKSIKNHWLYFALFVFSTLISGAVTYFACGLIQTDTLWTLIAKFAICAVVPNVMLLLCLWWTPEFKECVKWGIDIFKNFKHSKACASGNDIDVVVAGVDIDKDGVDDVSTIMVFKDGSVISPTSDLTEGETEVVELENNAVAEAEKSEGVETEPLSDKNSSQEN